MPVAMRRAAMREALSAKISAGEVAVVEGLGVTEPRTKVLVKRLRDLGVAPGPTLLVVSDLPDTLARASRNVPWLEVSKASHASVYQLVRSHRVVFERAALLAVQEALSP
jgi:large subunit ribosomal protein L4